MEIARRELLTLAAGAGLAASSAATAAPASTMMDNVRLYDGIGIHRTATETDWAATGWLVRKLRLAGFEARPHPFAAPLFVPKVCRLAVGDEVFDAFPAWPVMETPAGGVTAAFVSHEADDIAGKIVLVRLAREPGGTWDAKGVGDVVMAAAQRRPLAIAVVTENPTGEVVALNIVPARYTWPVPVVLIAGRFAEQLGSLAATSASATLTSTGIHTPSAKAANVVGRRPGRGPTIVVSTPKTGWFHCAGERATGLAVFLETAGRLARRSDANLVFVAFAGHELNFLGAHAFQRDGAPPPSEVAAWLHIGANAAMQPLSVNDGVVTPTVATAPERHVSARPSVLAAAAAAFTADAGFAPVVPLTDANAAGELSVFHADYPTIAGIIGTNPLFHTPVDRATYATTPAHLEAVADAAERYLAPFAKRA